MQGMLTVWGAAQLLFFLHLRGLQSHGNPKPKTRNPKPETLKTRNAKPETLKPKPEILNLKP